MLQKPCKSILHWPYVNKLSQILLEYHCKWNRAPDFHKMVVKSWQILKTNFRKLEPKIVHYRNSENFTNELFRENLVNQLSATETNANDRSFDKFFIICGEVLDRQAPPEKYIRGNHSPFINKTLRREIMKRTRLRNNFLKNRTEEIRKKYTK